MAPITVGSAPVSWKHRDREVTVLGSTAELFEIRHLSMAQGRFIPAGDPSRGLAVCVMGYKLKKELFGNQSPLGEWVVSATAAFGSSEYWPKKVNLWDWIWGMWWWFPWLLRRPCSIPLRFSESWCRPTAARLFPRPGKPVLATIRERHEGEDDVTVITQDALLSTFDRILVAMTLSVSGIAAISLSVAGILIMNVMLIAVSQRTTEIGLLKAIGARGTHILWLFLAESAILSHLSVPVSDSFWHFWGTGVSGMRFQDFRSRLPSGLWQRLSLLRF